MLRMQVMEDRSKYDFKFVQRQLGTPEKDGVYLEPEKLNRLIKEPQI